VLENPVALGGLGGVGRLVFGYGYWAWRRKKATPANFHEGGMGLAAGAAGFGAAAAEEDDGIMDLKTDKDVPGDVVVRLYESLGGRATARIAASFEVIGVRCTDLLERAVDTPPGFTVDHDGTVQLELRPFQIVTLRFARPA
jgi:hypothetical protein